MANFKKLIIIIDNNANFNIVSFASILACPQPAYSSRELIHNKFYSIRPVCTLSGYKFKNFFKNSYGKKLII